MPYELIYRGQFINAEGEDTIIHISDTTSGTVDPPVYHELMIREAELRVVSDEEKKTGIKGVRFIFSFVSTALYNLMTFIDGNDNRYMVEVFVGSTANNIFTGWLVLDSAKTKFLPDETFVVELTASDGLGILKELPLTDFTGLNPIGKYKIIEYLAWCFSKTNLQLAIHTIFNLFEENYSGLTQASFDKTYLEARTFEAEIGVSENSYEVLDKILHSFGCFATQRNGAWWICRVDEMNGDAYRYYSFSYLGVFSSATNATLTKLIGKEEDIKLIRRDAEIMPERKKHHVKQTRKLDYPLEIICNMGFERGDIISPIAIPGGAAYEIDCWLAGRRLATVITEPYIKRLFTDGYEVERYVTFPTTAITGTTPHYIISQHIPVNQGDKFNFSFDMKFDVNVTGSSGTYREEVAEIRLTGNNGTYWMVGNEQVNNEMPGQWIQTNSSFLNPSRGLRHVWNITQVDESKWFDISVQANPVPVGGSIQIILYQSRLYGSAHETHIANLQFEYIPLINGMYQQVEAQYHKVWVDEDLRANVEEEISISDSDNDLFKGTPFRHNGTTHVRTGKWYNYLAGTSGELGLERLGKYQAFALWNQNNRVIRKFTGTLHGLDTGTPTDMPSLLHRYQFTADNDHVNDKYYQLISYSMNLYTCQWSGTFSDVYDSVEGKNFTDDHEFKYITRGV